MSDFLARIAARAVGEAAIAQPRPAALFERPDPEMHAPPVSGDAQAPAPGRPSPARDEAAFTPADPPPAAETSAGPPERPAVTSAADAGAPVPPPPEIAPRPRHGTTEPERPVAERPGARARRVEAAPRRAVGEAERDVRAGADSGTTPAPRAETTPDPPGAPRPPSADIAADQGPAVATARAMPTVEAGREAAAPAPAALVREGPPPVRVHIGRLELRASLQPPPPERRPRRGDAPTDELSLADYLRGTR